MFKNIFKYIYDKIYFPTVPNLLGDRTVEYSFVAVNTDNNSGKTLKALDFGSGNGQLSLIAALNGYQTLAVDLVNQNFLYKHTKVKFEKKDLFTLKKSLRFDLIIVCSTVEHVGLGGRYGIVKEDENGDIKAMQLLKNYLKRTGKLILTIPVGKDGVFGIEHRVYGKKRLPQLLKNWHVTKEEYWTKNTDTWFKCSKNKALRTKSSEHFYGLGCFVLTKEG